LKASARGSGAQALPLVCLIAQNEHTVAEIMKISGVCRQTVFTYRAKVVVEVVKGLLKRDWAGVLKPTVRGCSGR
jgi:hypothetical protein